MRLYAIQRSNVAALWPRVEPLLAKAAARSVGDISTEILRADCLSGERVLLIVTDGRGSLPAAAVASFSQQADGALACSLDACGGAGLRMWRDVVGQFEDWARHRGAQSVRFTARPGWRRIFVGYAARPLVCLSKDLCHAG